MKKNTLILALFISITILMTYPLILKMNRNIAGGLGDPLTNSWILAWNVNSISNGLSGYWDTNRFYPNKSSLAYDEHLFGLSVLAFPVMLLTNNVVFTYNFMFLLSFVLSAFGAYLLVFYLTGNRMAGILSGIIFAFNPYHFAHMEHLQAITTQWIPLTFLYAHKYLNNKKRKHLVMFMVFFTLMNLSSMYYALFVGILIIPTILVIYLTRKVRDSKVLVNIGMGIVLVEIITLLFALPYIRMMKDKGIERRIETVASAGIHSYLSVPGQNRVYGKIAGKLGLNGGPDHSLFPGMVVYLLLIASIILLLKRRKLDRIKILYMTLGFLAFLFSLGPVIYFGKSAVCGGPYRILYNLIPGFSGIRTPARFQVIFILCSCVIIGFGVEQAMRAIRKIKNKRIICMMFSGILLLEYFSAPIPVPALESGESIPGIYKWLSRQEDKSPVVNLPVSTQNTWHFDFKYMYYSIYHWRDMLNGYASFFPKEYETVRSILTGFPSDDSIGFLQALGVKYALLRGVNYSSKGINDVLERISDYPLILKYSNNGDHVIQVALKKPSEPNIEFTDVSFPTDITNRGGINIGIYTRNKRGEIFVNHSYVKARVTTIWRNEDGYEYTYESLFELPFVLRVRESNASCVSLKCPEKAGRYKVSVHLESDLTGSAYFSRNVSITSQETLPDSYEPKEMRAFHSSLKIPETVRRDTFFRIDGTIKNNGNTLWYSKSRKQHSRGRVGIGVLWYEGDIPANNKRGNPVIESRGYLPSDVSPGQSVKYITEIISPYRPGKYSIKISPVNELIGWFFNDEEAVILRTIKVSE